MEKAVEAVLSTLRSEHVTYFPIRHHSPACAWHVGRWIDEHRPGTVLVEGPPSFREFLPLLVDPHVQMPIAIYTSVVLPGGSGSNVREKRREDGKDGVRYAAYYPFCESSPELVAVRRGTAVGAEIAFVDLEFEAKVRATHGRGENQRRRRDRAESLAADPHLAHSRYTRQLVRHYGCRDFDELWDHLFESRAPAMSTDTLIDELATYCMMARAMSDPRQLETDGTLAREAAMAVAIREAIARRDREGDARPVLVVTGGFHTVALPEVVEREAKGMPLEVHSPSRSPQWAIPFSFDRLDSLSGYASGMPHPGFYDRLWRAASGGPFKNVVESMRRETMGLLVEALHKTRVERQVSSADLMEATEFLGRLAMLRGHDVPTRMDVIEAFVSVLVREHDETGPDVSRFPALQRLLQGETVGVLTDDAPLPPLVVDFREQAERWKLPLRNQREKRLRLDLYRNPRHRRIREFLSRLAFLGVPYGEPLQRMDLRREAEGGRLFDAWEVRWSPVTESQLIELSVWGTTIEESVAERLRSEREQLGASHASIAAVIRLYVRGYEMGLDVADEEFRLLLDERLRSESKLEALAEGLRELSWLAVWFESQGTRGERELAALRRRLLMRACQLVPTAATVRREGVEAMIAAIEIVAATSAELLQSKDPDDVATGTLFDSAMVNSVRSPARDARPQVLGAMVGVLSSGHGRGESEIAEFLQRFLQSVSPNLATGEFVYGLVRAAPEILWRFSSVLDVLDRGVRTWADEVFRELLPELRLAFSLYAPADKGRLAAEVVARQDQSRDDAKVLPGFDLDAEAWVAKVMDRFEEDLAEIQLDDWLKSDSMGEPDDV